jgi:hypothetical protein
MMRASVGKEEEEEEVILRETWEMLVKSRTAQRVWLVAPRDFLDAFFHFDTLPKEEIMFLVDQETADRLSDGLTLIQVSVYTRDHVRFGQLWSDEWLEMMREKFPQDLFCKISE